MRTLIGFFAMAVAVAAISSFCTLRWVATRPLVVSADAHEWLHRELHVTPEQRSALEPIEQRFAETERMHREQMRAANRQLAAALRKGDANSPAIAAAVHQIHLHMGELQKDSIDHLFEMRAVLTPPQSEKLLQLAEKALEDTP